MPPAVDIEVLDIHLGQVAVRELAEPKQPGPKMPPPPKLPDKMKVCQQCGATHSAILTVCPDCRTRMNLEPDIHITETRGIDAAFAGGASAFSLASLFMLTTLVAIGCALATVHAALGVLFAVLILPAIVVTFQRIRECQLRGTSVGSREQLMMFLNALGLTIGAIVLAAFAIMILFAILGVLLMLISGAWR